jgi:membrane associated rhomboid family serine protease
MTPDALAKQIGHWEATRWLNLSKAPVAAGACILVALTALIGMISSAVASQYGQTVGLTRHSVLQGEWWRLFTVMAAPNISGFFVVFFGLVAFGRQIELLFGRTLLPLVFVTSALAGSIATIATAETMLMGATGGVFGVLGFLASIRTHERFLVDQKLIVARLILIGSIAGLIGFDVLFNAAHLGGLLCGLAWGRVLKKPELFARSRGARIGCMLAIGCFAGGAIGANFLLIAGMMR